MKMSSVANAMINSSFGVIPISNMKWTSVYISSLEPRVLLEIKYVQRDPAAWSHLLQVAVNELTFQSTGLT